MAGHYLGRKLIICLLIIVAYMGIRWLSSRPDAPQLALEPPPKRLPFNVKLTLPAVDAPPLDLSTLHGQVVLVNFWATWCYPCRAEMPSMQAIYNAYHTKGFTIVAISSDAEGLDVVGPFATKHGLTFPILLDRHNWVGERFLIPGIPTSYLLDKQSRIAAIEIGARDWNSPAVRRTIETLLAETPAPSGS